MDNKETPENGDSKLQVHQQQQQQQSAKKISVPFVEDRRRSVTARQGHHGRAVLCAVDASSHSRDAFEWYMRNIWKEDDLVIVAYCPETPNLPSFTFKKGLSPPVEKWKEIIDEANNKTRTLEEEYEGMCIEKKLSYMIRGESYKHPGEGICHIAEEEKVNMIVMGSRGMGAIKRLLLGSVSEYVVRHTKVPCIVVPGSV